MHTHFKCFYFSKINYTWMIWQKLILHTDTSAHCSHSCKEWHSLACSDCPTCTEAGRQGSGVGRLWMESLKRDVHQAVLMWLTRPAQSPSHGASMEQMFIRQPGLSTCMFLECPYIFSSQFPSITFVYKKKVRQHKDIWIFLFSFVCQNKAERTVQWRTRATGHCWVD